MIKISELYIHPLKSAAAQRVEEARVDQFGLLNDRRWMLIDEKGEFLSQRLLPEMCLIKAMVENNVLMVSLPAQPNIEVVASKEHVVSAKVWGDVCKAWDCGDEIAKILSLFLKTNCRMVYFPEDEVRQVDKEYAKEGDKTGFSDGFPLLLISQASLDDLNRRLDEKVTMTRFRPNIVVSGTEAFAEDEWKEIRVGGIHMRVVKPCSRCSIPSVNPVNAKRSAEPVTTLRQYRMRDNKVYFGQNVIADSTGLLEAGMKVEIVK